MLQATINAKGIYINNNKLDKKQIENPKASYIVFEGNAMTDEAISAIAQALSESTNITDITFKNNNINDEQASIIVKHLGNKPHISSVYFVEPQLSSAGAMQIANAFKDVAACIDIRTHSNHLEAATHVEILQILSKSSSIIKLPLYNRYVNLTDDLNDRISELEVAVNEKIQANIKNLQAIAKKAKNNEPLSKTQHHVLFSQLKFCLAAPLNAPKCDLNFANVMQDAKEQFMLLYMSLEDYFLAKGICKTKLSMKEGVFPLEIVNKIISYIDIDIYGNTFTTHVNKKLSAIENVLAIAAPIAQQEAPAMQQEVEALPSAQGGYSSLLKYGMPVALVAAIAISANFPLATTAAAAIVTIAATHAAIKGYEAYTLASNAQEVGLAR